jgi:microcystin-dependent protein
MAVIAGAVAPGFVKSLQIEAAKKTALEMSAVSESARIYYVRKDIWPDSLAALGEEGLVDSGWRGVNPFGENYSISTKGSLLTVKTTVPEDMTGVVSGLLPLSSVSGREVATDVTPPGESLSSVPAGAVMPWTSSDAPDGWLICDGSAVSRSDYAKLFSALGVTFGSGDGANTFNLPDLRGRAVVGLDNMGGSAANVISEAWARSVGGRFGEERHRLTVGEMPAHSHGYYQSPVGGAYDGHSSPVVTHQSWTNTGSAGGDAPHNNVQPSMALAWIIKY